MTLKSRILQALAECPDTRAALSAVCDGHPAKSTAAALSVLMREGKVCRHGSRKHHGERRGPPEIIYALRSNAKIQRRTKNAVIESARITSDDHGLLSA